jgi:hypothetical protein
MACDWMLSTARIHRMSHIRSFFSPNKRKASYFFSFTPLLTVSSRTAASGILFLPSEPRGEKVADERGTADELLDGGPPVCVRTFRAWKDISREFVEATSQCMIIWRIGTFVPVVSSSFRRLWVRPVVVAICASCRCLLTASKRTRSEVVQKLLHVSLMRVSTEILHQIYGYRVLRRIHCSWVGLKNLGTPTLSLTRTCIHSTNFRWRIGRITTPFFSSSLDAVRHAW